MDVVVGVFFVREVGGIVMDERGREFEVKFSVMEKINIIVVVNERFLNIILEVMKDEF